MEDMTAQGRESPQGAIFEELRAMLQENERRQEEIKRLLEKMSAETGLSLEKMGVEEPGWRMQETERVFKEMSAETDRRMRETDRQIEEVFGRMWNVIENLMSPKLDEEFKALNFVFTRNSRDIDIWDCNQKWLVGVDVMFENDECAMAMGVNIHLTTEDVDDHLKRMEILRRAADERNDRRKYLGAVVGEVVPRRGADYALKRGFYVIIPSEETVDIEAPDPSNLRMW